MKKRMKKKFKKEEKNTKKGTENTCAKRCEKSAETGLLSSGFKEERNQEIKKSLPHSEENQDLVPVSRAFDPTVRRYGTRE